MCGLQVLYYLSGLTCTDQNVITKGYPQRMAAEKGIAFVAPDTSPRGLGIEGEDESYDFGTGAGFYVNATEPKWKQYCMYDYIVKELPALLGKLQNLDVDKASTQPSAHAFTAKLLAHRASGLWVRRLRSVGTPWAGTVRWCWGCATQSSTAASAPSHPSATP